MKYLVLFYLTEMLKEKNDAARMERTHAFCSCDPTGVSCRQSGAFSSQPAAHGPSVIKGCGEQKSF